MPFDVNNRPKAGDVESFGPNHNGVEPGDGVVHFAGGFSACFDNLNELDTLNNSFITACFDWVSYVHDTAVSVSALVGCVFDSRKAKRYRQMAERAADKLAGRMDPEMFKQSLRPDDPEADEAVLNAVRKDASDFAKAGNTALYSALQASGLV